MLIVLIGAGEEAQQQSIPMYFRSIDVCLNTMLKGSQDSMVTTEANIRSSRT